MSTSLPEDALSRYVPNGDATGHGASLFPHEPLAVRRDTPRPHLSLTDWLRQWLSSRDYKGFANRVLRAERVKKGDRHPDGDPIGDLNHMGKILRGADSRKFSIDWIWHFRDEFGPEAFDEFIAKLLDEAGYMPPVRKPDALVLEQRIAERNALLRQIRELLAEGRE